MDEHIGQKLQLLAQIVGWIFIGIGVIMAMVLWDNTEEFLPGFYALLGGAVGYISCWTLYGFGYLIEVVIGLNITTDEIKSKLNDKNA